MEEKKEVFRYKLNTATTNVVAVQDCEKRFDGFYTKQELTLDEVKQFLPFIEKGFIEFVGEEDENPLVVHADVLKKVSTEIKLTEAEKEEEAKLSNALKGQIETLQTENEKLKETITEYVSKEKTWKTEKTKTTKEIETLQARVLELEKQTKK